MGRVFPSAVRHGRRDEFSARGTAPRSFVSIEHGCCLSLTHLSRPCSGFVDGAAGRWERLLHGQREPKPPHVRGQVIAVPRDFAQPVHHIAGDILLLLE